MGYDVFLSHAAKDKVIADAVCAALEANGVRAGSRRDIKPSELADGNSERNRRMSHDGPALLFQHERLAPYLPGGRAGGSQRNSHRAAAHRAGDAAGRSGIFFIVIALDGTRCRRRWKANCETLR